MKLGDGPHLMRNEGGLANILEELLSKIDLSYVSCQISFIFFFHLERSAFGSQGFFYYRSVQINVWRLVVFFQSTLRQQLHMSVSAINVLSAHFYVDRSYRPFDVI
jgi:hypothetical protein